MDDDESLALYMPVTADADEVKPTLIKLLLNIRPAWNMEQVEFKRLTQGFLNLIWLCSTPQRPTDKIIIRIWRCDEWEKNPIANRDYEYRVMREAARKGIIPPVYCRFTNGMAYEYMEGRTVSYTDFKGEHMMTLFMEKLHNIHQLKVPVRNSKQSLYEWLFIYQRLKLVDDLPDAFDDPEVQSVYIGIIKSKEHLRGLIQKSLPILDDLYSRYPLVLLHQDVWYNNAIYDVKTDSVGLIDWEFAGHGVEPLEFCFLCEEWMGEPVSEDFRRKVIRAYLTTHPDIEEVTPDLEEQWYRDVAKAGKVLCLAICCCLPWLAKHENEKEVQLSLLRFAAAAMKIHLHYTSIVQRF